MTHFKTENIKETSFYTKLATCVLLVLLSSLLYECRFRTDIQLWNFKQQFKDVGYPEGTKEILQESYLEGYANYCQYKVFEVRTRGRFSLKEIEEYYINHPIIYRTDYSKSIEIYSVEEFRSFTFAEKEMVWIKMLRQKDSELYVATLSKEGKDETLPFDPRCV